MSVERFDGSCSGEAGGESSSAELGCSTTGSEHGTDSDVFDEIRIDAGASNEGFECAVEQVGSLRVFETAFAAFRDRGSKGAGYYYLRGLLV